MHYSEASYRRRIAIEDELLAMLQEVPFEQITVLDIAQRQNIARKTFYHYFPNKQACLEGLIDRAIYECSIHLLRHSQNHHSMRRYYEGWLSFWMGRRDLLDAIIRNRLDQILITRLAAYTRNEDTSFLNKMATAFLPCDEDILHFYLSGQVAMLIRWGAAGFPLPMEEMVEKLYRLIHEPLVKDI
jgi:AcrR family transcriptional regulator